ncbi:MAG: cytochrome c biogenesis protein CcsA [Spirochaetales bacterium]|nr:cytochrome c biogenesis protein CcsA [Spirochaetales bacterium]
MIFSTIAFAVLLISLLLQIISLFKPVKIVQKINTVIMALTALLLLADFFIISFKIEFIALTNMYESLIFYSAIILIISIVYTFIARERSYPSIVFGMTIIAFVLLSAASSPLIPKEITPPIPALQSYWLVLHVSLAFIGEAFFAVSFISSLLFLFSKNDEKKKNMETITVKSITIGYPLFTAGAILFGAIWAYYAWGRFWGWDPKETWALVTWLTYTIFLHLRLLKKAQGKTAMIISIVGFLFTLFTFFGVNFLLSGLHSYL